MDLQSILGYSQGSPYAGNPYLDIHTPEGLIDMSNTPIDLIGIDNLGNKKKMKAGTKNPYKFEGSLVREIPMKKGGKTQVEYAKERGLHDAHNRGQFDNISPNQARQILHDKHVNGHPLTPDQYKLFGFLSKGNTLHFQEGGNIYQKGGFSKNDILSFLYDDDVEKKDAPSAPTTTEVKPEEQQTETPDSDYEMAMRIANGTGDATPEGEFPVGNPYDVPVGGGNPYKPTGKESPNAIATLQEFQPQGFTNLGIWPSAQHLAQNPNSDHNTGKALDLGITNLVKGDEAVSKLQSEAQEKNIKYIIWNRKIWNPQTNTWKPYSGKDPHTSHIHISFNQ